MEKRIRTAVLVSGGGTNLQAIIDRERAGELPHAELALVLSSQEEAYALTRAEKAGIPAFAVSRQKLGSQAAFEKALLEKLEEYRIEMIILAGFLSILSPDFTARYEKRILNVHPALLPAFDHEAGAFAVNQPQAVPDGAQADACTFFTFRFRQSFIA